MAVVGLAGAYCFHLKDDTSAEPPELEITQAHPTENPSNPAASLQAVLGDGSVVVSLSRQAAAQGMRLKYEERPPRVPPLWQTKYSSPVRMFRLDAFGPDETPWPENQSYPITISVLLDDRERLATNGDLFRLNVLRCKRRR